MKAIISNKRHVFKPTGEHSWSLSHAQVPFMLQLDYKTIRVFYATRDKESCSSTAFVDLDSETLEVIKGSSKPSISKGQPGYFDDSGVMPSWFLKENDELLLYYTAWNRSKEASYRLSIGLAKSDDYGLSFNKCFEGPILDRGMNDPIWVGQPCVLKDGNEWKMWYLSCQKIQYIDGHPEPFYNVKYATSGDGINWNRTEKTCIDFNTETDAIGRPCVWKHGGFYFMLHSNRQSVGYRTIIDAAYRLELSYSEDGLKWKAFSNFDFKKSDQGWDDTMNEYTSVLHRGNNSFLVLYNGNGFGATGFGAFELELEL